MQIPAAARVKFEAYINDWPLFAREYLRVDLDPEQEAVLRSVQVNPKTSVASGTSRGKDFVAAVAALCFLYLTPRWNEKGELVHNTKVILTGPTQRQVDKIMMPEVTRVFQKSIYLPGELTTNQIKLPNYKEWYLLAFKADENNVEAWTGFHAVNILFVVTEASRFKQVVMDAIEGNLQNNSRLLIVFNHNINTGYAHNSTRSPEFHKFRLNSLNAPNVIQKKMIYPGQVDYRWVKDRVEMWCTKIEKHEMKLEEGDFEWEGSSYRPNDLFRYKILGLGPKVSEGVLIPMEWIEAANARWKEHTEKKRPIEKPLRLGVDIGGMGRDGTCKCLRYGDYVLKFDFRESSGSPAHMEIAGQILVTMRENLDVYHGKYPQAFLDTIGEGAGVYSSLVESSDLQGNEWLKDRVYSAKFSEAAKDGGGNPLKDLTGQYDFLNMRAYLYWAVRDWLDPNKGSKAMLPPDDRLAEELSSILWAFRSKGDIQIEEKEEIKKRLKRSPDRSDALAETFWPVPDVDPRPAKQLNLANMFH